MRKQWAVFCLVSLFAVGRASAAPAKASSIANRIEAPTLSATVNVADDTTTVVARVGAIEVGSEVTAGDVMLTEGGETFVPASVLAALRDRLAAQQTPATEPALRLIWQQLGDMATEPARAISRDVIAPLSAPREEPAIACGSMLDINTKACSVKCTPGTGPGQGVCSGCKCSTDKLSMSYVGGIESARSNTAPELRLVVAVDSVDGTTVIRVEDAGNKSANELISSHRPYLAIARSSGRAIVTGVDGRRFISARVVDDLRGQLQAGSSPATRGFARWADAKLQNRTAGASKTQIIELPPVQESTDWCGSIRVLKDNDCAGDCTSTDTTTCPSCGCHGSAFRMRFVAY